MGPGVPMLLGCCLLTAWTWNGHAIADDANPRIALPIRTSLENPGREPPILGRRRLEKTTACSTH